VLFGEACVEHGNHGVIFNDHNLVHVCSSSVGVWLGMVATKVVPTMGTDSTRMVPPHDSIASRTRYRPVPRSLPLVEYPRSKMWDSTSGFMPGPVSSTLKISPRSSSRMLTVTSRDSEVGASRKASNALSIRLPRMVMYRSVLR